MKTINGKLHMTAADLIEDLKGYEPDQVLYAITHERDGRFAERPIYKTEQDCDETEVYLYLSYTREDIANISRQTPTASGGSLDGVVGGSE